MSAREGGFYWVRLPATNGGGVEVAEWDGEDTWYRSGTDIMYDDSWCEVLSERLTPPPSPQGVKLAPLALIEDRTIEQQAADGDACPVCGAATDGSAL